MNMNFKLSRREVLSRIGGGVGALGLASVFADAGYLSATQPAVAPAPVNPLAPKPPHFPARAKRLIFLFMNGGPSHVDTFDPKPALRARHGQPLPESFHSRDGRRNTAPLMGSPFTFHKHGQSGIEVSELYPHVGGCIDDICVLRSMWTENPNHEPGLLMMNSGNMQPLRPSMGSWLTYALGSENQNLPGYVVLCPGRPVVGPQLWSNSFLPGIFQGTHINNSNIDPRTIIRDINNRYLHTSAQRSQLDLLAADESGASGASAAGTSSSRPASLRWRWRSACRATPRKLSTSPRIAKHPCPVRRRRIRQRLPAGPPPGRARRPRHADLLRQRPALGRSRRHQQPPQSRPAAATGPSPPCSRT